ncbi:protein transport protein Sec16A isoform X5 [Pimephales promelas]|uniref:protein transport protein Sec16A isoform X5 n=1 Tax=Pimephales promelas TaxID=90988 RepID=UPI0019556057|nr:protein transport protein Sec16A isoform X5 [Pimephales promelas]
MQPSPRAAPPGASGPPPSSGGPNAFRRNRPHKHVAAAAMTQATPPTQPVTDPFAFGRQSFLPMAGGSQAPPTNSNPLPMQGPPLPGFNSMAPLQGPPPGTAQAASPGPPPRIFTPQPVPLEPSPSSNPPPAEPGYFNSQESMPYIAQLPNPAPPFSSSPSHQPSTAPTPPVQSQTPFQSQPTPPLPSHWVPDHGSRPPSVQNYFQPTSDHPSQHFQAQVPPSVPSPHIAPPSVPSPHTAPPSAPSPHTAPPLTASQYQGQFAQPNVIGPCATLQQNSHFPAQNYFSQSGGPSEPWFNQSPQDQSQRACPVPYSEVPSDSGTLSMFFGGNDVENEETLSGEGRVNGILHPLHSMTEFSGPYLNDSGNIRAGAGPCDSVENLECVPNQEVLPNEPPSSHAFEGGANLETPDSAPHLARSASVSSSYSNVSHSSGHGPHSSGHIPRRQQGVVGTFIQQESPRPPDHPPLHSSTGGYFEQIDSNPAAEASATFPTPSPPKPVGVFQASANSSFEPVRSHGVGVRPAEVDRARMVMEKGGSDVQHGNLEQPPDNLETIYLSERRPSSRAQGARRPIESPATTLWAQNDTASLGANILLAPAAPSLAATFVPAHPSEVIQPPEDGPLDLHSAKPDPQPPSENLEIPPDSMPQVTKDAQLGGQSDSEALPLQQISNPPRPSSNHPDNDPTRTSQPPYPPPAQHQLPPQVPPTHPGAPPTGPGSAPPLSYPPQSGNYAPQPLQEPQRPPSSLGGQSGYGAPSAIPPAPGYAGYYPGAYPEYHDGRLPYPPQYPIDPRSQNYYQDDPYRRDPRYAWYDGQNPGYREAERQPERPSSRTSQYSDRPNSRQGYQEDLSRSSRSAYDEYYANYYKRQYDAYGDKSRWYDPNAAYDPRYKAYYDPTYGWYYDLDGYRKGEAYYNQQYQNRGREGYDDPWRYYPGYDSSFDDDSRRRDPYADEFDRRSVHSEQSAHSVHSSHSRRSSFSSRSQQSQVYRSQPDLVSAAYDTTGTTLPVDYTYSQYTNPSDTANYSQIPYNPADNTWTATDQPPPRPLTPEKYSIPHRCARFGPAGQLILVQPNLPSAGQPTLVEIHSMETILQDSSEQAEMRSFPGPLVKEETHKVDVIKFAQNKAQECLRNDDLIDKDSAFLIWEFIVLLCRQNGTVVGTDIADLLLKEHRSVWLPGKSPNEANLIDFNNEAIEHAEADEAGPISLLSDTFMGVPENVGKETERFRELLLFGRKKDALESAMKKGLWGHALLLASKMDNRTHARVMTRFANSLPINDPLQTVYQLMSGRMPAAATCCGDEKWGDWRPHLAMVLSNLTHTLDLDTRTISTMGDTLASKGLVDAAHFCYLMAQVGFGVYTKKSTKMVLISSNHSMPFLKFCSSEAIQRTESYEYAQSLGSHALSLPNFQVFKFIYACRLAESGLCAQAFHYCEVISRTLLNLPEYYSPVFISQLIQMSLRLRFFDPQLKERPEQELFIEPDWLLHLRQLDGQIKDGVINFRADRSTPQLYPCSTPSSEDHCSPPDPSTLTPDPHNPLMASVVPQGGVQLMPPAPPTILQDGAVPPQQAPPPSESVPFYPGPPQTNFVATYQPETHEQYTRMPQQIPPQIPQQIPPQMPTYNSTEMMPPGGQHQMPPGGQHQMPPGGQHQMPMGGQHQMPMGGQHQVHASEHGSAPSSPQQFPQLSPTFSGPPPQGKDFYDEMARMGPGRRSRTTSQSSSIHMVQSTSGRRSRTMSESSNHSGRDRSSSLANQGSPPPPPIPEAPPQDESKKTKKDSPKKGAGGSGWLTWLYPKRKNEAHLPDDKNKTIVWDEKKQKWVNLDEPEEESKPPPPPPTSFPKAPMGSLGMGPPGAGGPAMGPPVNMFSRRAGTKSRYVDVLNPGRGGSKPTAAVPPPADLFAPLAPMAMPTNLFTPAAAPGEQQPMEGSIPDASGENTQQTSATVPQMFNPNALPPGPEGTQSGELSRSSSMSSLSREVSQHLNQVPAQPPAQAAPPAGGVTFYNPSQFAQSVPSSHARPGRLGQRGYPTVK